MKSDHENSAMPTSKQNRKQWSSKKEMSITKLESPPTLKSEQPEEVPVVQPRTSISSLIAEEVRQKRESFLKKLEENERRISQNGSMNGENLLASVSSTRSASRRSSFGKREELPQKITTGSKTESVDAQLEDEGTKVRIFPFAQSVGSPSREVFFRIQNTQRWRDHFQKMNILQQHQNRQSRNQDDR